MKNQCKDHGINAMVMGSVLNVVIDHAMEEITPMDTEEWNSKIRNGETENENIGTKHILVPVIRIFGPLKKANGHPLQSCCLYVHGAFPYFLARPVIAGPDGSLYPASSMSTHVNWDNRHEVETIQGEIQATLEDQLQSSFLDKGFGEKENDSMCKRDPEKGQCAIVRKVTIVEGRGFYTFCPGPTTVFLRVEYYDPKLRWKVKLAMERGLQLPQKYHPDCKRYDRVATDDTDDLLRFNCYEAHVPYTMQFFKDNNLAGMKFVHVLNGRIRGKLPRTISKNFICSKKKSVDNFLFLQSNTPINDFWPKQDDDRDEFSSFCNLRSDYTPPQKNTTCDVELDCTVNEISGMTLDQDESGTIQWRAVPNLREIWKEERARMKILLSPEATQEVVRDVLSNDKSIDPDEQVLKSKPFTLNTDNENSPKSGTKLATRGMWSLVNVSNGLQDDFIRSLTDILERHKETILKFDEQLQKGGRKMIDLDRTKQNLRYEERKEFFSQLATPGSNEKDFNLDGITPPTMKEAISALKSLGAQNLDSEFKAVGSSQSSSSPVNEAINAPGLMTPSTAEELKHGEELKHRESTLSFMPQFSESKTCKKIASCEINLPDLLTKGSSSLIRYNKADVADSDYVFPGSNATQNEFDEQNNSQVLKAHSFDEEEREDHISTSLLQPGGQCIGTNDFISQRSRMFSQSLTYSSSQEIHENSMSESFNPVEFSQRMERGDSVLNTQYQDIEDLIDPDTLAPYERTFFGEGCCRAIFAVDTDLNDMKRICGLNDGSCSREGHKFADNRARPGIYSTISTGGIVDGKMHDFLSKADDEDEDCELLEDFCQRSQNFLDTPPPKPQLEIATPIANSIFTQINDEFNLENAQRDLTSYEDGSDGDENVHIKAQTVTVGNITKQSIDKKKDNGNEYLSNTISHERILLVAPKREQVKSWNLKLKRKQTDKSSTNPRRNRKLNNLHKANNVDGCNSLNFDSNKAALKGHEKKSQRIKNGKEKLHQTLTESQEPSQNALDGICNQGGRIFLEGGGGLKAKTKVTNTITSSDEQCYQNQNLPTTPVTILIVEVHVQCRVGSSRLDSTKISMTQDSNKDMITAIVYVHARDHGGGESIEVLSRGCICLTLEGENPNKDRKINKNVELQLLRSMPRSNIGVESPLSIEVVKDERYLLRRFKDIVRIKDPDLMLSWDTQGAGIGYIIERGHSVGNPSTSSVNVVSKDGLDMAKLLGRTPMDKKIANIVTMIPGGKSKQLNVEQEVGGADASHEQMWRGSGLGADWDERVGAGAAAASIVGRIVLSGWKIISEEVKHPNSSYLPAIVHSVLNKRIPHHDNLLLTKWYARSTERWRVLNYKLTVAISSLLIFDRLDIIGRAGEAARLSGVEFSQSFPGIRGSQYKVEGVLLRALQSLHSDERGSKKGKKAESGFSTQSSSISNESTTSKSQSQSPWKVRRANYRQNESPGSDDRKYFFFSPSQEDTKKQEALEVQALTLEPQSGHFTHPVVVCDFTALYPSLIIAYNLCYSTCAGKLDYHSTREEMQMEGKTTSKIGPFFYSEQRTSTVLNHHLKSVSNALYSGVNNRQVIDFSNDRVYVSPTGTIYLSESVLKGVLPQVLDEMLTTRAMLKRAAKQYKKHVKNLSPAVLRQLEARQLALKYVANVTYGYTSATFSGRCAMVRWDFWFCSFLSLLSSITTPPRNIAAMRGFFISKFVISFYIKILPE